MEDRIERRLDQHGELIAELRAATLANSQRIGELQEATAANSRNLDRLAGITERFVGVVTDAIVRFDQAVEELRASNRRQEALNDFLIRRLGGEGNGGNPPAAPAN
ncbi:hypothetical protein [Gloeobacter violaceus]|uniref:Glr0329 protein n=1 Tax=Gloeobacter violaceus (strain ATCC 29082 / PCC 7421) TaxID=251221 RepID=Q7NNT1_GLOVI|nr:hypothetical protein [Gloeobacter violaceus]BAC88270.1 glr0329 [Gloeobacter violaceus PCC 7421]